MVDYLEAYKQLLQRAANAFEQLIQLYAPDVQDNKEWAVAVVAEAQTKRNGYLERLAHPLMSAAYTGTFVSSIMRFLDEHWPDPTRWTQTNPAKAAQIEQIHTELRAIMTAVAPIHNALRTS
jgi:pantothenate kinase-related protein Tda10